MTPHFWRRKQWTVASPGRDDGARDMIFVGPVSVSGTLRIFVGY
jgi:hypothetical protein